MSDSLWPHGLQHIRLPCPSPTPESCSNSCPSSQWCHPIISSFVIPFSSCLQSFPASGSSVLHIRRPKYWSFSFSISPSNEQAQGLANFHSWAKSNFLPFKIYCIIGKNLRNSTSWHMEIIWHSNCSVSKVLGGYSHHHCLCFVCICFCTAVMEVNSCNRHMACRA